MAQGLGQTPPTPISVFGGLVTNMSPSDLPLGASPDCPECSFLPGAVFSRPAFKKAFATHFGTATVTYAKTYVDPSATIRNLYQDSSGNFWVENVTSSPGTYSLLTTTTPGNYAKSITAFGREYIAINDTLHGADVPLQLSFDDSGTAQLDRVTQDGPGSPPVITSVTLPTATMATAGSTIHLTVSSTGPYQHRGGTTAYYGMTVNVVSGASTLVPGTSVVIAGNTNSVCNGTFIVSVVVSDTQFILVGTFFSVPTGTGGTATFGASVSMARSNNVVTVNTSAAHNLQVGYQAQITGVAAAAVGTTIATVSIVNENLSGVATVTTNSPHGLVPGLFVSLNGILGTAVGGGVTSISRQGQIVTAVTASANGLNPGAVITLAGFATASFNTVAVVQAVTNPTTFTFLQADIDATDTTGTVTINWPIPDTPTPSYFQVLSAPTPTTFQVQVYYSDGSWTGGTVSYAWDGTFFVASVPSSTSFTYQQYGPVASTTTLGTVTPYGQATPGKHLCCVSFLTRQGAVTAASPWVQFITNGGQYLQVSNLPIGPSNVVARIIQFTGAQGAYFYYIPSTPQVNGVIVGTPTQINDNTSPGALLDFSDNTLFAALGTTIQGNNLQNQIVLEGALGFAYYDGRLLTYGQRNIIQGGDGAGGLLNMGFDGGYLPTNSTLPTGWLASGSSTGGGALVATGRYGFAWQFDSSGGILSQSLFEDVNGAPIAVANQSYIFRAWVKGNGIGAELTINSASLSYTSIAAINGVGANGGFFEAAFSLPMPSTIPPDLTLILNGNNGAIVDEMSLVIAETPYLNGLYGSYEDNPEGIDGVSGVFGPVNDTHQVLDVAIIRDNLYMLTKDPNGRLHRTSPGVTEPVDWETDEVAANCGAVSTFCTTRSQADDSSAAGGEEWFAWYSSTGLRIFGGSEPFKISQEIQRPLGQTFPGAPSDLGAFNTSAQLTTWVLNDPQQKILYLGIPTGSATAPNVIYQMSYLGMDSAAQIAAGDPVHRSLSGKMIASDLGRKWSPWNRSMNGAALMYRTTDGVEPVFFAGNGATPVAGAGFGNVYTLDPNQYTDDDYGQFSPYYVTSAIPDKDEEIQLGLGAGMKMITYIESFLSGVGFMTQSIYYNSLGNLHSINSGGYLMSLNPLRNMEWGGGQASDGQRYFIKSACTPNAAGSTANPTTDNAFTMTVLAVAMKKSMRKGVAGTWP